MRSLWENVWEIAAAGTGLQLSLVRVFLGKRRVLRTAALETGNSQKLIETLGKQARWTRAFLSLGRDQGIVRGLQLPVDIEHDLRSVLNLQIEAISAWPEQEVYWDYRAERSKDDPRTLQITVAVIPKSILDPWLKLFESLGLPLTGATLKDIDVNVIPAGLRRRSARAQAVAAYALAACVLVLAAAFFVRDPYQQRVFAAQIQREITHLEPEVKDLVRRVAELDTLTKRHEALAHHIKARDSNIEALKTLATVLPSDTFVLNYRYQGETVTILGVSTSALDVQIALEKSAAFKDVQFAAPITRETSGKDRFALKMTIEAQP